MPVRIENPKSIEFRPHEERVLRAMFADYARLVVLSRLAGGFSGSRVYMVRPIRDTGPELPAVVKIDLYERIQQEWEAFTGYIRYRLPSTAEIRGEPVNPPSSPFSGVWYPLAGEGIDNIDSLHNYLLKTPAEKIEPFLTNRLFKRFLTLWQQASIHPSLNFQAAYDDFLPINLNIQCTEPHSSFKPKWLDPDSIDNQKLSVGDFVQVSGFKIVKLLRDKQGLSLDSPKSHESFRIHVYGIGDVSAYEIGQIITRPFTGLIKNTRQSQLNRQAQDAVGPDFDLQPALLTLPNGRTLPNPLANWRNILSQTMDVRVAFIHGDLNMENVLVDMDTETIHLIDFAKSGRSHVIRDLLHLEMAVINKILSEEMQESDSAAAVMDDLYCRLHCILTTSKSIPPPQGLEKPFTILKTIREAARPLIFQTASWQEYYTGLFIYLLGSLRFPDLNDMPSAPFPKQLAFWGSAVILDLLENEPDCTQFEASKTAVATTQSKPQSKVAPTSTEPETGSTIWDSDKIVADWQTDTLSQRITLFNILKTNFSMDELVELGLHVGVELEDLPGSGRPRKAQELIGYFERRGQIRTLIEGIRSVRPTIEWR